MDKMSTVYTVDFSLAEILGLYNYFFIEGSEIIFEEHSTANGLVEKITL